MERAPSAGRVLAEQHAGSDEPQAGTGLLDYAEWPRAGKWTLRPSLVRLAQPEPLRAGAVLDVVRRLDAALHSAGKVGRVVDIARLTGEASELDAVIDEYESVLPLSD